MDYIMYGKEAISLYPITYQDITFIRHNENMIFKISDSIQNKAYVLRIHNSKVKGLTDISHTYEGLQSENGQLKPAFNLQHGLDSEYITCFTIEPQPTDTTTLILFLKKVEEYLIFKYQNIPQMLDVKVKKTIYFLNVMTGFFY